MRNRASRFAKLPDPKDFAPSMIEFVTPEVIRILNLCAVEIIVGKRGYVSGVLFSSGFIGDVTPRSAVPAGNDCPFFYASLDCVQILDIEQS